MIVIRDLRNGCLTSLDVYLRLNRGIPDREVAVELRKLIAGTQQRANYRLVAVAHPDGPPPQKGAPPKKETVKPTQTDLRLFRAFERAKAKHGNVTAATSQVMTDEKVSKDMVGRARASVRKYTEFVEDLKAARRDTNKRADAALAKVRLDNDGE